MWNVSDTMHPILVFPGPWFKCAWWRYGVQAGVIHASHGDDSAGVPGGHVGQAGGKHAGHAPELVWVSAG